MGKDITRFPAEEIISTLPPGQCVTREYMLRVIAQSVLPPRFHDSLSTPAREVRRNRRRCEMLLNGMIRSKRLVELPDGRLKRDPLEDVTVKPNMVCIRFLGIDYWVRADQKEQKIAELKAMSPQARRDARLAALEQQLEDLKKDGNDDE